jgi:hypothetical protein
MIDEYEVCWRVSKRTSHKLQILSSRLIFVSINHIYIQMTCLSFLNQTQTRIYDTSIGFDIWRSLSKGVGLGEYFESCDFSHENTNIETYRCIIYPCLCSFIITVNGAFYNVI